jgi:hypothetical protein
VPKIQTCCKILATSIAREGSKRILAIPRSVGLTKTKLTTKRVPLHEHPVDHHSDTRALPRTNTIPTSTATPPPSLHRHRRHTAPHAVMSCTATSAISGPGRLATTTTTASRWAGAYTGSLLSSTSVVPDARKHPTHHRHPSVNTPLTRATNLRTPYPMQSAQVELKSGRV